MFRTLTLAAAATVALSGAAAATESYIAFQGDLIGHDSAITLSTVRAAGDGMIEIYDFHKGEQGMLLGSAPVRAGANSELRVNLGAKAIHDVIAVLRVGDQVVDTLELDFAR